MTESKDADYLCLVFRQQHRQRLFAEQRQPIAFIGSRPLGRGDDSRRRKYVAKCGEQGWIEHRGTRPTGFDYSTNEGLALCSLYRATPLAPRCANAGLVYNLLLFGDRGEERQRELKR